MLASTTASPGMFGGASLLFLTASIRQLARSRGATVCMASQHKMSERSGAFVQFATNASIALEAGSSRHRSLHCWGRVLHSAKIPCPSQLLTGLLTTLK